MMRTSPAAANPSFTAAVCSKKLSVPAKLSDEVVVPLRKPSHLLQGAIGGASGCVAKTVVAPLSRIVIQMQLLPLHGSEASGILRTARSIYAEGGLQAFWRGNGAMLGHRCLTNALNFPVNELFKKWMEGRPKQERNFCAALAGSAAGTIVGHPLDVIKTKLSASKRFGYEGILQSSVRIWQEEGFRGFYAGFRISCGTIIPTVTVCFYLKDFCRDLPLVNWLCVSSAGWLPLDALAGALGGCGAALLFFPLDVWKRQAQMVGENRRLQVEMSRRALGSAWQSFCRNYHGLPCELLKVSVNTGIMFGLYAKVSQWVAHA